LQKIGEGNDILEKCEIKLEKILEILKVHLNSIEYQINIDIPTPNSVEKFEFYFQELEKVDFADYKGCTGELAKLLDSLSQVNIYC
jgi:hypothetical protein